MAKFIELTNTDNEKMLVNIDEISCVKNMENENIENLVDDVNKSFIANIINLMGDDVKNEYNKSILNIKNAKACIELRHVGTQDKAKDIYTLNSYHELKLLLMD